MKRALSRDIEIAYEEAGRGDPAVILIHAPFWTLENIRATF
jgi:hypothetical protein